MSVPKTFWDTPAAATLLPPGALEVIKQLELYKRTIQPPAALWVDANDLLTLKSRNSLSGVNLQAVARVMEPDGRINTTLISQGPSTDRSINTTSQALYEGYLLSASVIAIGPTFPTRGQTYATLQLLRMPSPSNLTHFVLGADYVTGSLGIEWPYGRTISPLEGQGVLRSIAVTTPAAGANWTQTVPTGARWRVRDARFRLVTSAVAGSRVPVIRLTDGVNVLAEFGTTLSQAAGVTVDWNAIAGQGFESDATGPNVEYMQPEVMLLAGWIITVRTPAIDVGDQYSAVRLTVEEWIED